MTQNVKISSGWTWINISLGSTKSSTKRTLDNLAKHKYLSYHANNVDSSFWLQHIFIQDIDIQWVEICCWEISASDVACLDSDSEWNPEAFHKSMSKCWMWWDFSYNWWNILKIHNNSIHFKCFRLVLWWWL